MKYNSFIRLQLLKTIYIKLKNKIGGIKAGRVNNCNCKHSKNKNVIEENIEIEEMHDL